MILQVGAWNIFAGKNVSQDLYFVMPDIPLEYRFDCVLKKNGCVCVCMYAYIHI